MGAGGVINRCLYLSARYRLFYPAVAGSSAIIKRGHSSAIIKRGHWLVPAVAPLHNYVQKKCMSLARIAADPMPVYLMRVSGHQALSALVVVIPDVSGVGDKLCILYLDGGLLGYFFQGVVHAF